MGREVRRVPASWQHPTSPEGWLIPLYTNDMPQWKPGEANCFQMYENVTEGTPVSPVMDSPEALAKWLDDNKASAFGDHPASYEAWLKVCRGRAAHMATISRGEIVSGVEDGESRAKPPKIAANATTWAVSSKAARQPSRLAATAASHPLAAS